MYEYMIFHSPKGHHIPGSMRWVTTGQSGVFAIPSDSYRVHYLESSRGVVNPSTGRERLIRTRLIRSST